MNRFEVIKAIRKNLHEGGLSIGSWMQIPDPSIAEIMGQANYEWVAVDMEHGSISHSQLPNLFRALELGGTLPLVRIAEGTSQNCKQALDAGAGGVIVPMVETAEQLMLIRDSCCWPPAGARGVGFSRANLFGQFFERYSEEAQQPLLVAMIEHIRAVDNLDKILQVKGLDAILIGPYDLSASLGLTGQFEHTKFMSTMQLIKEKAFSANIPAGIHVVAPSREELTGRISEGYKFIAFSIDAVLFRFAVPNPQG